MTIQLTPQQQQTLDTLGNAPPRVVDPRNLAAYVLVPESDYETVREILEHERCRKVISKVALRNAAGRMEDVP